MKEKHVFAGNNTSKGFYSYFDHLINVDEANRIYILKGGPGVGKSSFMKKFSSNMLANGYSVEFIHCSSDNDSLDGIIIPELKLAFVDGTAPHTIDPILPGAVDEIINLGIYLNNKELVKHKTEIIKVNKDKSRNYKSAYRFLECAGLILEESNAIYDQITDHKKFIILCEDVIKKIFTEVPNNTPSSRKQNTNTNNVSSFGIKPGKIRKLFTEAYTANGYINHTDSLYKDKKVWEIIGKNINYSSEMLNCIVSEAVKRGYDTECYYRPLTPEKLQHILIPELELVIKSAESQKGLTNDQIINLSELMDQKQLNSLQSELNDYLLLYKLLIDNALKKLSETKKQHELLEAYYIESMDFNGVNECFEKILAQYK